MLQSFSMRLDFAWFQVHYQVVTLTAGSITMQKFAGSPDQGIMYTGAANDPTVTYGLSFVASNCTLAINNITIQDFSRIQNRIVDSANKFKSNNSRMHIYK